MDVVVAANDDGDGDDDDNGVGVLILVEMGSPAKWQRMERTQQIIIVNLLVFVATQRRS